MQQQQQMDMLLVVQYWARSIQLRSRRRGLNIDFTRLRDDAAPVNNPPSKSSCNVAIRHYIFIVTWVNCGYAWVRKGRRVVGTLLRNLRMGV